MVLLALLSALGGTRTPNLLIRSQMLYPIEPRALGSNESRALGDRCGNGLVRAALAQPNQASRVWRPQLRQYCDDGFQISILFPLIAEPVSRAIFQPSPST